MDRRHCKQINSYSISKVIPFVVSEQRFRYHIHKSSPVAYNPTEALPLNLFQNF